MEANEFYPKTTAELEHRRMLQRKAMAACRSSLTMIDICAAKFSIKKSTVECWTKELWNVRNLTVAWLKKDEEIYNIFDTGKFLNRPPLVAVSNTSGLAGIAHWINSYYRLGDDRRVDKNSELVSKVKEWVDKQYDEGRITVITDNELVVEITKCCKELGIIL